MGLPYFTWAPMPFAAQYSLEVYKNGDTHYSPTNKVLSATPKFVAWSPISVLPVGQYAWRVKPLDANGLSGAWSESGVGEVGRTFTLSGTAPKLLAPADGFSTTSASMLFSWGPVDRAVQYRWELSNTVPFSTVSTSQPTVMTAWAPLLAIPDGPHSWRVSVLDANNNVLATSASRSFTKDTKQPFVSTKGPLSAAAVTGPLTATFSENVTNVTTNTFTVVIAGTATPVAGIVTAPTPTTAQFTPIAPLMPGQSYTATLTSGITDLGGNPLVPAGWTVRTSTTVDDTSAAFTEVWDRDTSGSASGGSYDASQSPGDQIAFTFTGTNAQVLGTRSRTGGYADVYLDGVRQAPSISFYSAAGQWQSIMWSKTGLTNAVHTVDVRPLGTKPSVATGAWVYVDAFRVGAVLFQENNPAVREAFRKVATSFANGGSYDRQQHAITGDTGRRPYYQTIFKGTRVTVYGTKSAGSSKAVIYVDNALRATVDLRGATAYQARLFSSATLTNAVHTIRIEVVGSPTGANSWVGIDYLLLA